MISTVGSNELPANSLVEAAKTLEQLAALLHRMPRLPYEPGGPDAEVVVIPADAAVGLQNQLDDVAEVLRGVCVSLQDRSEIAGLLRGSFMARVAAHLLHKARRKEEAEA